MGLNDTCFPIDPLDILPDGTPCIQGFCNKGACEKTIQDVVERFWDIIEDININKVMRFLKDNIVGAVILITATIWIPSSCVISYVDRRRVKENEKKYCWKNANQLIHPDDKRRVIYISGSRDKVQHFTPQSWEFWIYYYRKIFISFVKIRFISYLFEIPSTRNYIFYYEEEGLNVDVSKTKIVLQKFIPHRPLWWTTFSNI